MRQQSTGPLGHPLVLASLVLTLCAAPPLRAIDLAPTVIDPLTQRQQAVDAFVSGPAPSGFSPFVDPSTGLSVLQVSFDGNLTRDGNSAAIAFFRNLTVANETLASGVFLSTGSANAALPPDDTGYTTVNLTPSRSETLVQVLNNGAWTYDAQRLEIVFTASAQTESLRMRWVFGTEEYPEYVHSTYNDVFGCYLFGFGAVGPAGGLFSTPPAVDSLINTSWDQLTTTQRAFLASHQIAFDANGNPITVNGPFFAGSQVVPAANNGLEYDGSTRILTTVAPLVPGQSYKLFLVIGDTDDTNLDSGVFVSIEGRSEQINNTETTSSTLGGPSSAGGSGGSSGSTPPATPPGGSGAPSGTTPAGSATPGSGTRPAASGSATSLSLPATGATSSSSQGATATATNAPNIAAGSSSGCQLHTHTPIAPWWPLGTLLLALCACIVTSRSKG